MESIVEYLSAELEAIQGARPDELDSLKHKEGGFVAWSNASAALGSFSGMLAILWEMAEERKGGARTMAEVAARYSRFTAERLEETLAASHAAGVMLKTADAYDEVKTYRDLSRIVSAHARWMGQLREWVAAELPVNEVARCVEDAWAGKGACACEQKAKAKKAGKGESKDEKPKAKGKKARKELQAKAAKAEEKAAKKAKRAEKGKKPKKSPRKGNKGKK